jgi:hypothetical protein
VGWGREELLQKEEQLRLQSSFDVMSSPPVHGWGHGYEICVMLDFWHPGDVVSFVCIVIDELDAGKKPGFLNLEKQLITALNNSCMFLVP